MNMTLETEANSKFCCTNIHISAFCQGSKCMAWQWEMLEYRGGEATKGFCGMVATGGHDQHQPHRAIY